QVHKETIDAVPNAIPGRTDIELEIYGMEGIPEKDMEERRRLLEQKTQADGQKKKQDDSDYEDDDESGPSSSFPVQMHAQQGYIPGLHGLAGPGMPPGIPHLMQSVPPLMPGIPPVMPGMPHGLLPMGMMHHHAPGIPPMMAGLPPGVPPPVGPRPGIPVVTQAQPMSAPGVGRLPTPSTSTPTMASVPKPLFPSAGQVRSVVCGCLHTLEVAATGKALLWS
ncbi:hypothetical protein GDO81_019311, partial [Engystomops pustulosus]